MILMDTDHLSVLEIPGSDRRTRSGALDIT